MIEKYHKEKELNRKLTTKEHIENTELCFYNLGLCFQKLGDELNRIGKDIQNSLAKIELPNKKEIMFINKCRKKWNKMSDYEKEDFSITGFNGFVMCERILIERKKAKEHGGIRENVFKEKSK